MDENINNVVVIIAEDDDGHAALIKKNLKRGGISNETMRFKNGEEVLDFLFKKGKGDQMQSGFSYLLLLDMRIPKVDGMEVLRQVKNDEVLRKMPVIMLTTTDDPTEINKCHEIGCNSYVVKPINYNDFIHVIQQLGIYIKIVKVPPMDEEQEVED
ncbi:response regulator [Halobacillus seohaensis]|uniref:Response regulator n=1 Tax=Halobacillus seohaensis TaxID=447421 RepID=A0ABW2EP46_9BACI